MIKDIKQLDLEKRYTYADYLSWKFDDMVELIRGKVFRMAPAPGTSHQWISGDLHAIIRNHLIGKPCKAFAAPFDVRLSLPPDRQSDDKIDTVVQPDISVICDLSKLDEKGCNGAPDWIVEILSKGTSKKDLTDKFDIYRHVGVKEYWVIHPSEETVIPYRLDENGNYHSIREVPFVKGEKVPVGVFPDFEVDLDEVFPK